MSGQPFSFDSSVIAAHVQCKFDLRQHLHSSWRIHFNPFFPHHPSFVCCGTRLQRDTLGLQGQSLLCNVCTCVCVSAFVWTFITVCDRQARVLGLYAFAVYCAACVCVFKCAGVPWQIQSSRENCMMGWFICGVDSSSGWQICCSARGTVNLLARCYANLMSMHVQWLCVRHRLPPQSYISTHSTSTWL